MPAIFSIANEYLPQLPSYLPAPAPPQVSEHDVHQKIQKLKNSRLTLPLDLPNKLRNEFAVELTEPLTSIINNCLNQQVFPTLWKFEWVSPIPKVTQPKVIKDIRKISPARLTLDSLEDKRE